MKLTVDSPWIQTGTKITNLLILNACFTLGCLPVFTIGASLTATFDVAMKIAQEREDVSIIRSFVQAYRANFKRGMGMVLLNLQSPRTDIILNLLLKLLIIRKP